MGNLLWVSTLRQTIGQSFRQTHSVVRCFQKQRASVRAPVMLIELDDERLGKKFTLELTLCYIL